MKGLSATVGEVDKIEQLQSNVLTYTTTHKEQLNAIVLYVSSYRWVHSPL